MEEGYQSTVQDGKIKIPSELGNFFRTGALVICRGTDRALFVYQEEVWKAFGERLFSYAKGENAIKTVRYFLAEAIEPTCIEGWMEIPVILKEFAGIEEGDVVEFTLEHEEFEKLVIRKRAGNEDIR